MDFDPSLNSPIQWITVKHPDAKCTCDGSALAFSGHSFSQNIEQYLPPTGPALTQAGKIAKRQPPKPKLQPHTWWRAQCAFRGLNPKGTREELQERLRGHEQDPISKGNLKLLETAKKEFKIKRDEAIEDNWLHKMSAEEKVRTNPGRYLKEAFPAEEDCTGVVVIKGWHTSIIGELAEDIGLEYEAVKAPLNRNDFMPLPDTWVVVGQKRSAVAEKLRSISREAQRIEKEIQQENAERIRKEEVIRKKQQQDLKKALANSVDWDVTGTWKISCPYIEENYGNQDSDDAGGMSLRIYLEKTPKGSQMFAKFNFGITKGVFRFERQRDDTKVKAAKAKPDRNEKKRKRYDSDEEDSAEEGDSDEEEEDDEDEFDRERSPTPEAFYFGTITKPSAKYQSWNYRWRGEETGEGVIELYSDKRLFTMKFFGPKVEKLEATFGGDMFEDCTFTGVKVVVGGEVDIDIAEEWAERNESAYESARVGRWH